VIGAVVAGPSFVPASADRSDTQPEHLTIKNAKMRSIGRKHQMKKTQKFSFLGTAAMATIMTSAFHAPMAMAQEQESEATRKLDTVTVTAQRREESLQNVPIQVSVATAEILSDKNIDNGTRFNVISPSIQLRTADEPAAGVRLLIRGLGTTGPSVSLEGGVGVFVDGVYRSRNGAALSNFLDYQSVQVLKGPQSTLFGKNTSAGAVLLTSTAPDLSETAGSYEMRLSNFDSRMFKGAVNLPLVDDKLAVRASLMGFNNGGYVENVLTGRTEDQTEGWAAKVSMLFEPSETMNFNLIADWSDTTGECCVRAVYTNQDSPVTNLLDALAAARGLPDTTLDYVNGGDFRTAVRNNGDLAMRDKGLTLRSEFDLGLGTLTSITAYREWFSRNRHEQALFSTVDVLAFSPQFESQQFSQELLFDTKISDSIDALFGVFYSDEDLLRQRTLINGADAQAFITGLTGIPSGATPGTVIQKEYIPGTAKSMSVFTNWTFALSDKWTLAAGGRLSKEEKTGSYDNIIDPPAGSAWTLINVFPAPAFSDSYDEDAFSGAISLSYNLSSNATIFGKFSRGFKAGGVILDSTAAGAPSNNPELGAGRVPKDPTYKSEFVNAYELGGKFVYWDGRASTNVSLFYNDIEDLQVPQFLGAAFSIVNSPSAEDYGVEIENSFVLSDYLTLNLAATYIPHAEYGFDADLENATSAGAAVSGERFLLTPEWASNATLDFEKPLSDRLALIASAGYQYTSEQRTNSGALPIQGSTGYIANQQPDTWLVDLSVGLKQLEQGWSLSAYCNNCSDERYVGAEFGATFQTGSYMGFPAAPRTWGVALRGKF
tara:strand:- start:29545 stop:32031 length:2487 start_codon:yes stop_codon:yes gene_type:complete